MATKDFSFLHDFADIQFMPVLSNKRPVVKGWQTSSVKHNLSNCDGVGLVCGKLSGGVEAIDLDLKYDLTGTLYNRYRNMIHSADKTLLEKLVVQKTKSNGYHFIYRCKEISGNLKLANRETSEEEKNQTYRETYDAEVTKSGDDALARKEAEKAAKNDKVRVLLETRGEGGYIMCSPSDGYELVHRDWYGIEEITPEQREILFSCARQFNEVFEQHEYKPTAREKSKQKGLTPFDDYNQRADVVALLQSHGWKYVNKKGSKIHLQRAGATSAATSGNWDENNGWFSVFTTSTQFEPQKAYRPYAVFAVLECDGDFSEAARKLSEMGYGERDEKPAKEKAPSTRVIQSRINPDDDDLSFLATPNDYDGYLQQVIDGTLPMGLTTGSPILDEYFLFKIGNMVNVNGIDNVGKTRVMLWLQLIAGMYHGWEGILFCSENRVGSVMRTLIELYWGKSLTGQYAMTNEQYKTAEKFVNNHFHIIKAQEDLYNYKDIMNMVKKARKKYPNCNYGMIDPYNSLKIDLSGFSKLNTHEFHYEALSELKAYGQQNNFGWFINHHAYTGAARQKDGEKKYPLAPNKADTEGGQRVANKTDDFLTIHRLTQHPTDWMVTEIHVRKIKETETGGRPTPLDMPVRFESYKGGSAFVERPYEGGRAVDPIYEWHLNNGTELPKPSKVVDYTSQFKPVTGAWSPFNDGKDDGTDEMPF